VRSWQEDAADVAHFEWWLVPVSLAIATAGALILLFGFGLSFWLSIGVPLALVAIYWSYRYLEMVKR
jgi:hypothetical protein